MTKEMIDNPPAYNIQAGSSRPTQSRAQTQIGQRARAPLIIDREHNWIAIEDTYLIDCQDLKDENAVSLKSFSKIRANLYFTGVPAVQRVRVIAKSTNDSVAISLGNTENKVFDIYIKSHTSCSLQLPRQFQGKVLCYTTTCPIILGPALKAASVQIKPPESANKGSEYYEINGGGESFASLHSNGAKVQVAFEGEM